MSNNIKFKNISNGLENNGEFKFNWPILGHKNIIKYLQGLIINQQSISTYLFFGPEDVGKKTLVNLFIKSIFCFQGQNSKYFPCEKCKSCKDIDKNIHPDYITVDLEQGKKNISINQIKKFQERLYLTPVRASCKIALINKADTLSLEAANALLKIIEEPPRNSIIILIANKIERILPTIRSRTQNIVFHSVPLDKIYDYLKEIGASPKLARELAEFSGGAPGLAITYYKNLDLWKRHKYHLNKMLEILDNPINDRLNWVDEQVKLSKLTGSRYAYFETLLNSYLRLVRDLVVIQISSEIDLIHPFLKNSLIKISKKYKSDKLLDFYKNALLGKRLLSQNINPKTIFENLLLI